MVSMAKPDNTTPVYLLAVMPSELKNRKAKFFKPSADVVKTLDYIAISTYPAKNSEKMVITRKDGSVVMNHTVYAGFTDGTYTSLKCDTALAQAISVIDEDVDLDHENTAEFTFDEPFDVGFTQVKEKMGKKEYDYWAFNPQ